MDKGKSLCSTEDTECIYIYLYIFLIVHKSVIEGGNYPGAILKELGHFHVLLYFLFAHFWL